ncbi:MAG: NAD-dependent epimerase [Flavobacteriaceae bacterium]|nr:NAD-dependent epimerase [Flavobacteriaceae bacterium]|tara:strand:- start:30404 stop:31321 length:918 start_codon:yes stop_codon:yes gene_type:complete
MNRILITGALGQLGSALLKHYHDKGIFVLATDIHECPKGLVYNYEKLDALNFEGLLDVVKKYEINVIYHLAAILSAKGEKNPFHSWKINMDTFQNIVDVSLKCKIERVFWPSSIAVFGKDSNLEYVPQNSLMNPTTLYGVSKLAGEKLMNYYFEKYQLDIRSIRFPGIISMDTKPGGGVTDYIIEMLNASKKGNEYICFLDKNQRLPMIFMEDVISAITLLMSKKRSVLSISSSYNIVGFTTTPEECLLAIKSNGINLKVHYKPDFRQKIANTWPENVDDSLASKDWGWSPKFGLDKTVKIALNG